MPVMVRPATSADAEFLSSLNGEIQAIHAVFLRSWFKPPGPQTFPPAAASALVDNPGNLVLVAEDEREPAGYVYASVTRHAETPWRYAYETMYVHHIGVRAGFRRRGIGGALMTRVRAEAASRNVALLSLDVWSFNADAKAFFRRQGFEPYQERLWSSTSRRGGSA
jgi:ribosomal protein S18 acetylase RimI-like enzyme